MKKYYYSLLLLAGFIQINADQKDLPAQNYSEMTTSELDNAFVSAVQQQRCDDVQKLIEAGADINTPIPYTWTEGDCDWFIETSALTYAVRNNRPGLIKVLVTVGQDLSEALDEAIKEGRSEVVEELIKGGADINLEDEEKNTPLMLAIEHACISGEFRSQAQSRYRSRWQERRNIIITLIESGADVNHVNANGKTPLMEAVLHHDFKTVKSLLSKSETNDSAEKSINHADLDGNTAFMLAVIHTRYQYQTTDSQGYEACLNSQNILSSLSQVPGIDFLHVNNKGETALSLLNELTKKMT